MNIVVEGLSERQAHVRAAIDIAVDAFAAAHHKSVEAPGAHFQHEGARGAVGNLGERAEADAGWGGGEPFGQGSCALVKPDQTSS